MFRRPEKKEGASIRPLPETVTGKPTRVIPTQGARGSWDMANHVMQAPHGDDPTSRVIRAHEMAHAKHTDPDAFMRCSASEEALRSAEDARINCIAQAKATRRHAPLRVGGEEEARDYGAVDTLLEAGDLFAAACHAVARTGLPHAITMRETIDYALGQASVSDPQVRLLAMMYADVNMKALDMECDINRIARGGAAVDTVLPFETTNGLAEALDRLRPPDAEAGDGEEGDSEEGDTEEASSGKPKQTAGDDLWGEMRIVDCNKPVRCVPRARRRKRSDEGDCIRDVARAFTDGVAFDKKRRVQSRDVLLIDASGSMEVDLDEVEEAVRVSPDGIVACYDSDPSSDTRGKLQILAARGMRCTALDMERIGFRNVVDLPALRWALDQARGGGKITWITDGSVGGRGGYTAEHARACQQVTARHRVDTFTTLREWLDAQRR